MLQKNCVGRVLDSKCEFTIFIRNAGLFSVCLHCECKLTTSLVLAPIELESLACVGGAHQVDVCIFVKWYARAFPSLVKECKARGALVLIDFMDYCNTHIKNVVSGGVYPSTANLDTRTPPESDGTDIRIRKSA